MVKSSNSTSGNIRVGKIFIGPKGGNATKSLVLGGKHSEFGIPVYAEVFDPVNVTVTLPVTDNVIVNCESIEGKLPGYATLEFNNSIQLNAGSSMKGEVKVKIDGKGRAVNVRCFGSSAGNPADPQFVIENSYSSSVSVRVTKFLTAEICESVVIVPVEPALQNYSKFRVELTVPATHPVEVACERKASDPDPLLLNLPSVPISVGGNVAEVKYSQKAGSQDGNIKVSCRGSNSSQFSPSKYGVEVVFKKDVGILKLSPRVSEIQSMSFELILTVDQPVVEPAGLQFSCGATTFETYADAAAELNTPTCHEVTNSTTPSPTTTTTTPTTTVTTIITSTSNLNDTDNSTTVTLPTTTLPTTTVVITTPVSWQVMNPSFIMKESEIYQSLTVMRMKPVPAAVQEYVVVSCCVPDTSTNPKYQGKIDAVLAHVSLQRNISVDVNNLGSSSERKIQNPGFQEYAPCPCDLLKYECDIECCCDNDCSDGQKQTFAKCVSGLEGGQSAPVQTYNCYSTHFPKDDWFPMTCVQFESNAFLGYFYQNQDVIRSSLEFTRKLQAIDMGFTYRKGSTYTDVLLARSTGYTYGSFLRTRGRGLVGTQDGVLTLPQRTISGECVRTAPVQYLRDFESTCVFPLTEDVCTAYSVFSALMYAEATSVIVAPCKSGYKVLQGQSTTSPLAETSANYYCFDNVGKYIDSSTDTAVGVSASDYQPAVGNCSDVFGNDICKSTLPNTLSVPVDEIPASSRCNWDDSSQTPSSPIWERTSSVDSCQNTVLEVRYTFTWSSNKVLLLKSDIIMGTVPAIRNGQDFTTNVTQKFSVKFLQQNNDPDRKQFSRSGFPGYDVGKPLWSGYVQDANFSVDTSSNLQMGVFNTGADGVCDHVTKRLLNFGEDVMSGCYYSFSLANFTNCDYMRKLAYNLLNEQLMTANYIGRLGYNNVTERSEWIEVLRENISAAFEVNITDTEGVINTANGTLPDTDFTGEGLCKNIPSGINLDVMYGVSGLANGLPINEVIGAYISFTLSDWQFVCSGPSDKACNLGEEVGKPFYLTSTVNFIKVPANTPREPIKYWRDYNPSICDQDSCWKDLFFPLTEAYEADSFHYALGFTLLAFLFTIAFFLVTNPMWYTFALLCVTVFFLVFYYLINFWMMRPTYI